MENNYQIMQDEYNKRKTIKNISEEDYWKIVDSSDHVITKEKVIKGIKYLIEHQSLNQDELIEGLINIGCTFTINDVINQFIGGDKLLDGLAKGSISCGALVIINMRDSEIGRMYCDDVLLSHDGDYSLYNYIRILTNDINYTKDNIDNLNRKK